MNKIKLIGGLLAIFVSLPIWFYLVHFMLEGSNAGELQWFLFWIYVPVVMLIQTLATIAASDD